MGNNREDLISKLANSMGVSNIDKIRQGESYYDPSTATLYCKGQAITKNTGDQAIRHFEMMESRCDIGNAEERQMALIYRCAIEAIKLMKDPQVMELMKTRYDRGEI